MEHNEDYSEKTSPSRVEAAHTEESLDQSYQDDLDLALAWQQLEYADGFGDEE